MSGEFHPVVFEKGKNCYQIAEAKRIAFLIDGEAYFGAVASACEAARRAIYIIGWDIDSRILLRRAPEGDRENLGQFLDRLARQKPELQIYILDWDFAMLYSLEREFLPLLSFGWKTHERVRFELDDYHPVGASHHQKIVVVDGCLGFVGGFDLACSRWDTPDHAPDHPQRNDNGKPSGPFHDVQMMVDGDAAEKLGTLARHRWERATGEVLPAVSIKGHDCWPKELVVDLENAPVAILRTEPEHDGHPGVREVERFYLDAIAEARRSIYIENQYLTSDAVGAALERTLQTEKGPEILIVLPRTCSGWLEEETMGALRKRVLARLRQADVHQRLKVCYPHRQGLGEDIINVHSKILIIDDTLLTIGSANLSNRSMGLDTECNLALFDEDQGHTATAIGQFRNRLLAEHLGAAADRVAELIEQRGSLLFAVEALDNETRSLKNLAEQEPEPILAANEIVDPERPIGIDLLLERLGVEVEQRDREAETRHKAWRFAALIGLAALLAALWRWSPMNQWLTLDNLLALAESIRQSHLMIPMVLAIFVLGSCLMFPITLLILVTAISFGPFMGFALALCGSLLGGLVSYLAGHWLGRDVVRRFAGRRLNRLSRRLARRGWLAVALLRVVPIAPFTIVNLVAGSTHISTRSFLIGTAVGMGPGILAIMIFEGGLEHAIRNPDWGNITLACLAVFGALLILIIGRRWLMSRDEACNE